MSPTGRDARETRNTENKSSGKALQNAAEKGRGVTPLWPAMLSLSNFWATTTRMSETDTNESAHKWPGFDVPVPNFEPAEGKVVGLSRVHANGLELLLEIEVEGKCNFVLAESGASV